MTATTLTRVTLDTLANYGLAATKAMEAYRLGSHRLVDAVDKTLTERVYTRTAKVAPIATERLNTLRGNVSGGLVKGIDGLVARTEQAIEFSQATAASQLHKVAGYAAAIDNPVIANGLRTAARLSMPGAKVALALSSKVAESATALAGAAGAQPAVVRKAKAAVKATAKTAVKRTRAVAQAAAKVVPAKATRSRAKRAI